MKKTGLFYVIAILLVTSCIQENLDGGGILNLTLSSPMR